MQRLRPAFFQADAAGFCRDMEGFQACQGSGPQDPGFQRLHKRARRTLTRTAAILRRPLEDLGLWVSLFRKEDVSAPVSRLGKIVAELPNWPSRLLGKSHEMEAFLQVRP